MTRIRLFTLVTLLSLAACKKKVSPLFPTGVYEGYAEFSNGVPNLTGEFTFDGSTIRNANNDSIYLQLSDWKDDGKTTTGKVLIETKTFYKIYYIEGQSITGKIVLGLFANTTNVKISQIGSLILTKKN